MIIGNHQRNISTQPVRNQLREFGLRARRPFVGIVLTQRHRQIWLQWARRHLRFTRADWANVLFTDETRFNLRRSDGRLRVYRRRGERYSAPCVKEKGQFRRFCDDLGGNFFAHKDSGSSRKSKDKCLKISGSDHPALCDTTCASQTWNGIYAG